MSTSQTTFGEAAAKLLHFTADRLAVCVDAEENTEHELENIERLGRLILGALDLVCTIEHRTGTGQGWRARPRTSGTTLSTKIERAKKGSSRRLGM